MASGTFADRLARIAPDLDQVLVALMNHPPARLTTRRIAALLKTVAGTDSGMRGCRRVMRRYHLIAMQWLMAFDAANLVMLYLLAWWWWHYFTDAGLRWLPPS